jgi:anti-sigma factor RsiW
MAEVLNQHGEWTAEERAHLAQCTDCAAEVALMSKARAIGHGLPPLDLERVAARVGARLADRSTVSAGTARFRRWSLIGLATAAVVALAVLIRPKERSVETVANVAAPVAGRLLTELDELSASELEVVLRDWDHDENDRPEALLDMGELTPDELERVLRSWEG